MRLIKQIPHERYLIQVHQYNGKFILKVELGAYEQLFKISESEISDLDNLEASLNGEFLSRCLQRFISMRSDWEELIGKNKG
jgi:hypothetical protein